MKVGVLIVILSATSSAVAHAQSASLVPRDWVQEPRSSPQEPLRYTSPDGEAWLALSASRADPRHPPKIVRREGEDVTYRRVTRRFVAISGYKGDRIFYRKSNLACGGTRWHHISLEYPARDKRKMDALVTRAAHGMNRFDNDCRGAAGTTSGGLVRR